MRYSVSRFLPLLLCAVLTVSCGEQEAAPPPQGRPPTPVRVAPVLKQAVQETVALVGTVEPWKRSVVASEVEGVIRDFPAKEGRRVKQGDVLAHLRMETLAIQLDAASASQREASARHEQARRDLIRIRALFDKALVTNKEFDDARSEERALRERLSQLDADIRRVRDQIAKSKIVAPFDGWITRELTEVGQWVEAGGDIIEMVDVSHVQVEIPLPERYVRHIQIRDAVLTTFDSLPGFEARGRVFSLVAQADRVSRTFPVKVDIPNPSLAIKSGMVSRVTLHVGQPRQGVVIPKDALVLRGNREFVFLVKANTVDQVPVTSGVHLDDLVEVTGMIREGMTVVTEGNERLFPGQPVRILDAPASAQ